MENVNEEMAYVEKLIEQLKHDDLTQRVAASNQIARISRALGPERTREELIPFIIDSTDDEDEFLQSIALNLKDFSPLVGGVQFSYIIFEVFEVLAAVEDNWVRDAVVNSIEFILQSFNEENILEIFVPFLKNLALNDWFTTRITAANLFHIIYKKLPINDQKVARSIFFGLCYDAVPLVRRVAACNLSKLVPELSPVDIKTELLEPLLRLSTDEQDSVRIQCCTNCAVISSFLPIELKLAKILPIISSLSSDKSWRVRWSLANNIHKIYSDIGSEFTKESLISIFESLLLDYEAEVRSEALLNIPKIVIYIKKDVLLNNFVPCLNRLVSDPSEFVRYSLGGVIADIAGALGKDDTINFLLPLLLLLLRDENSDVIAKYYQFYELVLQYKS